jgi:hypothetical protein
MRPANTLQTGYGFELKSALPVVTPENSHTNRFVLICFPLLHHKLGIAGRGNDRGYLQQ